jgi:peptide/nickel transport system permease protein
MIKEGATAALLWKYSYLIIIPALSVSSLILGFNMIADGLRELGGRS